MNIGRYGLLAVAMLSLSGGISIAGAAPASVTQIRREAVMLEREFRDRLATLHRLHEIAVEHDAADRVAELVTRRQAWQFRILPLRFEGRELLIATTQQHLRRALRFATNVIGIPVFFVMADPMDLGRALCDRFPLPGMTPESVIDEPSPETPRNLAA